MLYMPVYLQMKIAVVFLLALGKITTCSSLAYSLIMIFPSTVQFVKCSLLTSWTTHTQTGLLGKINDLGLISRGNTVILNTVNAEYKGCKKAVDLSGSSDYTFAPSPPISKCCVIPVWLFFVLLSTVVAASASGMYRTFILGTFSHVIRQLHTVYAKKKGLGLNTSQTKHNASNHRTHASIWEESAHRLRRTLYFAEFDRCFWNAAFLSMSFHWYAFPNFYTQFSHTLVYNVRTSSKASAPAVSSLIVIWSASHCNLFLVLL